VSTGEARGRGSGSGDDAAPTQGQIEALERTVERFAGWVQFGDAKAAGVLVLLGIALADLLTHADPLVHGHRLRSNWGDVATVAFIAALAVAALVVIEVSRALFPRVKATTHSAFFFGSASTYPTGSAYTESFLDLTAKDVADQLGEQAWELARIASRKFERTRHAYWLVLAFLSAWAVARSALAMA
jgi:Pycsar effector protein